MRIEIGKRSWIGCFKSYMRDPEGLISPMEENEIEVKICTEWGICCVNWDWSNASVVLEFGSERQAMAFLLRWS